MSAALQQGFERWERSGRDPALLLPPGPALGEGERLLMQSPDLLTAETAAYVRASLDHQHTQRQAYARWLRGIAIAAALTAVVFAALVGLAIWLYATALTVRHEGRPPDSAEPGESAASPDVARKATMEDATADHAAHVAELASQVEARADEAARMTYLLAEARWRERRVGEAYELLETIPPERRRLEWRHAHRQMEGSDVTLYAEGVIKSRPTFTADGMRLFAVVGGALKSWDAQTGAPCDDSDVDLGSATRFALSDDSTRLAYHDRGGTVCVWDLATDARLHQWAAPSNNVTTFVFSPDAQTLAWIDDQGATVRDAASREVRVKLQGEAGVAEAIVFSADASRLAAVDRDGTRLLWDARSGELLSRFAQRGSIGEIVFSPDGRWLAAPAARDGIEVLDLLAEGVVAHVLNASPHRAARNGVQTAAFSPDGTMIAVADDASIYLWETATGRLLRELAGHTERVSRLSFSNDGARLASAGDDRTIKLWNLRSPGVATTLRHADATGGQLAFSATGETLVAVSDRGGVQTFEMPSGQTVRRTATPSRNPELGFAVSSNGRYWARQEEDRSVRVVEVATGVERTIPAADPSPFQSLQFNRDGSRLVARGKSLRVCDTASLATRQVIAAPGDSFTCSALTDDGQRVAGGLVSGVVTVWNAADGAPLDTFKTSGGHYWIPRQLKFSRDGARLAAVYDDGAMVVWAGGRYRVEAVVLRGRTALCCDFSPDGSLLVSGDDHGGGALWNARTGERLWDIPVTGRPTTDVVFNSDGSRLADFHSDGEIRVWDLSARHEFKVALLAAPATSESVRSASRAPRVVDPQYAALPEVFAFRRRQAEIDATWHERQAAAAESAQPPNWYAAAFHVSWAVDARSEDVAQRARLNRALGHWRAEAAARGPGGSRLMPASPDPNQFFTPAVQRRLNAAKTD